MGYVYRYRDNTDGIIKYVGIVYGKTRTLEMRIREHLMNDEWCNANFTIEYITENINNRSEAEAFESHYISLYGTDKYFNKAKLGWGTNKYLPNREKDFIVYSFPFDNIETKILYEVYCFDVIQIKVYKDGDNYRCIDKRRKEIFTDANIEKYNNNNNSLFYTFDKEEAYLLAKEMTLESIKSTEDSYRKSMNALNKGLEKINAVLEYMKKNN